MAAKLNKSRSFLHKRQACPAAAHCTDLLDSTLLCQSFKLSTDLKLSNHAELFYDNWDMAQMAGVGNLCTFDTVHAKDGCVHLGVHMVVQVTQHQSTCFASMATYHPANGIFGVVVGASIQL